MTSKTGPKPIPESIRFWRQVEKTDGCWLWTGHTNGAGYGMFRVGSLTNGTRTKVLAHRWAYEDAHGSPARLDCDHQCHNWDLGCPGGKACQHRRCVRPDHLRDVKRSVNIRSSGRVGKR